MAISEQNKNFITKAFMEFSVEFGECNESNSGMELMSPKIGKRLHNIQKLFFILRLSIFLLLKQ